MDLKHIHTVDGQEVTGGDINRMGRIAARAEDRVFAELLRLRRTNADGIARGILPYGDNVKSLGAEPAGLVMPSGEADGCVHVYAFRAVVGSEVEASDEVTEGSALEENRYGVASGVFCGEWAEPFQIVQLSPTTNPRWDLVYATLAIDLEGPTVERQVKALSGEKAPQALAVYKVNTITLNVFEGDESAGPSIDPVRPAIPADGAGIFNIPLAYVRLPAAFGALSTIEDRGWVHTVAPALSLAPAVGGFDLRAASIHQDFPTSNDVDLSSSQAAAPTMLLPSDWVGGNQRFLLLRTAEMALGEPVLVDNSIDWRKRLCKATVQSTTATNVAWDPAAGVGAAYFPSGRDGAPAVHHHVFNTFVSSVAGSDDPGDEVLHLDSGNGLQNAGTAELSLTVDAAGDLYAVFHADIGAQCVFLWIEATAPLHGFRS